MPAEAISGLGSDEMCYVKGASGWKITGYSAAPGSDCCLPARGGGRDGQWRLCPTEAIERAPGLDDNIATMQARLTKRVRDVALIGAAALCILCAPALAQPRSRPVPNNQPIMADVPPGVNHGNSSDDLPEQFQRQAVFYRSQLPVGTVIIDTAKRYLYLIESQTLCAALRHRRRPRRLHLGGPVGRFPASWSGPIGGRQPDMIERQPYLPRFIAGGPGNPLGARAMYLGNTIYRIHGTNAPETIGHAVSSGCFRLVNDNVIDLYDRTPIGTHVIVRQN